MDADDLAAELEVAPQRAAEVIEAEVVSAPKPSDKPLTKRTGSYPLTPAQIRRRDRTFSEVSVRDGNALKRGRLSDRERRAINIILKTGSLTKAAEEIGVTLATIITYTKRPFVRFYLDKMRERAAKAADLTLDKVAGVLGDGIDGVPITPMQLAAAQAASRLLAPAARPGVQVNVQNNHYNGTSPFADLAQKDMMDTIKANLLEMGHDPE